MAKLLLACEGDGWQRKRDKAMLLLMLDTGLRVHEAFSLTQVQASQEATTIKGKGGKERLVLISAPVRLSLLRYRKAAPKSEALWLGHEGPLTLKGMILVIRSIGKRAGVKPFGPHRLRRTFATWSLRNGMDLESLRRLMGHSSLTILQQYLNLVDTDLKEAHRKFSPVLQLGKK
jgi:site-specific recombinase XerD